MRTIFFCLLSILVMTSCQRKNGTEAVSGFDSTNELLPDANRVGLEIKNGPGADAFIANCQTCHTARYVLMQPKLSRKAWEKTVDKMIHTYGAQIDSATSIEIVDYLIRAQEQ